MAKEEGIFIIAEDQDYLLEQDAFEVDEQSAFDKPELEFLFNTEIPKGEEGEEEVEKLEEENKSWLESHDTKKFHKFLEEEMNRIKTPMQARTSISEIERAFAQWKELDGHISSALRKDYNNDLSVDVIDDVRKKIQYNIDQLDHMLTSWKDLQRGRKGKKKADDSSEVIVKEAGTPMYLGLQTNMTLFETAIVRALINGVVSGGRNMDELFEVAKEKYGLTDREELAIFQALSDMGYPTFKDRLKIGDEDQDPSSSNIGEWQSQYYS